MSRFIILTIIFGFITIFQLGFISSLGGSLALLPFVLTLSVYMIQHHGLRDAVYWLIGYGFLLDFFSLGRVPFETLAYAFGGIIAVISARSVFSNRSFYGVFGCLLLSSIGIVFIELLSLWIQAIRADAIVYWSIFWKEWLIGLGLMTLTLFFFFRFGKNIRLLLKNTFLLGERVDTL